MSDLDFEKWIEEAELQGFSGENDGYGKILNISGLILSEYEIQLLYITELDQEYLVSVSYKGILL